MEKVELPIKTKIAACIIIVIGGAIACGGLGIMAGSYLENGFLWQLIFIFGLAVFCFFGFPIFLLGIFLLKRKKLAWWFSVIQLIIETTLFFAYHLQEPEQRAITTPFYLWVIIPAIFLFLITLILLLLDRKNFWKIAQ